MCKPNVVKEMIVANDPDNKYFVMDGGVGDWHLAFFFFFGGFGKQKVMWTTLSVLAVLSRIQDGCLPGVPTGE